MVRYVAIEKNDAAQLFRLGNSSQARSTFAVIVRLTSVLGISLDAIAAKAN